MIKLLQNDNTNSPNLSPIFAAIDKINIELNTLMNQIQLLTKQSKQYRLPKMSSSYTVPPPPYSKILDVSIPPPGYRKVTPPRRFYPSSPSYSPPTVSPPSRRSPPFREAPQPRGPVPFRSSRVSPLHKVLVHLLELLFLLYLHRERTLITLSRVLRISVRVQNK